VSTKPLGNGLELREFLQARRASLKPQDFGIQDSARRRAPGLRREEVASLAGVGLTWYTWLEQGRDIRVLHSPGRTNRQLKVQHLGLPSGFFSC